MHASIEARLAKIERRHRHRARGLHRYTDVELDGLIAWLREPTAEGEAEAVALLHREGLLP